MTVYIVYLGVCVSDNPLEDRLMAVLGVALSPSGAKNIALDYIKDDYMSYWIPDGDVRWTHKYDALEFLGRNSLTSNNKGHSIEIIEQKAVP